MKRVRAFVRQYLLFVLALAALIIALVLQLTKHSTAAHWLLGIVSIAELLPLLNNMWQDVRAGKYGIDLLAATAIVASVILGEYWAAIVIVIMLNVGKVLENFARRRARSELDTLTTNAPRTARVLKKSKLVEVKAGEIRTNDKIVINAGDAVPVDAIIIEGSAGFDESSLTGESLPQSKASGDQLLSGSVNLDGTVTAKALASAEDSQYRQTIKLIRAASASQAPFVRLADRYSIPFTVLSFAIAVSAWVLSGDAKRFLEVIVVATPGPLLLAAPIAVLSGMARASRYGIIVKTGLALERFAKAKTIAFDKTGTLTKGSLKADKVLAYGKFKKDEVLVLAASLEQNSNHLVAAAIVEAAKNAGLKPVKAKHVKEFSGRGLQAQLKGREIIVGRLSLLQENGVAIAGKSKDGGSKQTAVYVAVDKQLAGMIQLSDEIRPETPATLTKLRRLGVRQFTLVTGDNQTTASSIAKELDINDVHAEALPADKLRIVESIKDRPAAFVGDGVNDAPVLTASDIGIALGARGSTAAGESADMVIMPDDLSRVAAAREISRKTFSIARQSILVGILLSVTLMMVFATGKFTPLAGAIVREAVDVVVIFSALRAHFVRVSEAA